MMEEALAYWAALQPYRSERLRCKNYTYGKQWEDMVTVGDRRMSEARFIREQGSAPLKNNLIRRIVRNVLGVFRNNYSIPDFEDLGIEEFTPGGSAALAAAYERNVGLNVLGETYPRVMEEYLIGGLAAVRKRYSLSGGGTVFTDMVTPDSIFFNTDTIDPRGWDIHTIGEIHSHREPGDHSPTRRIVEMWTLEGRRWVYRFFDEEGTILKEGESPFPSGGHPYVVKAYPLIDGEIHSFVADCIDQQRYINRLITLNDWIIRGSAKGVLLFPEGAIPDDLTLEDIAAQWSLYNGVIRYRAKAGQPLPQQVATNATNVGITELLAVQLKMMEDVSGINAALQGQLSSGAVSGELYRQQTSHALTGLTDILEGFRQFMIDSGRKDVEMLRMNCW